MKEITMDFSNREVSESKVLDESHANDDIKIDEKENIVKKKRTTIKSRKSKNKSNLKTVRFNDFEYNKLEKYLKKNNIYFSDLVRDLLMNEDII